MENRSIRGAMRQFGPALLALTVTLLAAPSATAQFWISPDRNVVNLGQRQPLQMTGSFTVTPVVVPGNMYVRIGGSYSATILNPFSGYPGTGFVKPFDAADRARASNFRGSRNYNPNPIITGPWQKWW
jgi:hypothetical protein